MQKRAKKCRAMPIYNLQTSRVIIPQSCSDQTNFHFHITFTPFAHTVTLAFTPYTRLHSAATLPPKFWTQFRYPDQKAATGMGAHPTVLEDGHRSKNDRKRLPYWTTEAEAEPVRLELAGHVKKLMRRNWCCETDAVEAHRRPSCYKNTKCTLNKPK